MSEDTKEILENAVHRREYEVGIPGESLADFIKEITDQGAIQPIKVDYYAKMDLYYVTFKIWSDAVGTTEDS
jgi:hypothetical protein